MKEKLTNNLGLKLISLCLAVIFWLVVVTMEDPEQTKTLEIPVTRINEEMIRENDKTYEVIEGNTVTVTVRARQSILKDLTAKDFEAVADLANLSFTGAVPIEVTPIRYTTSQVTIVKGANTMMRVSIEDLASVDKVVSAKAEGTVITGKALGTINVEPNMIRIEGAKTTIDRISSVYSTDLTFSEEALKVNVSLLDTKVVPIRWNVDVTTGEGYGIVSQDYSPSEVAIAGTGEVLDEIEEIVLDDYIAENLTENAETEVDLEQIVKNLGASLVKPDSDKKVKLAIKVGQYVSSNGVIDFGNIILDGKFSDYTYTVIGDSSIGYVINGLDEDIKSLDPVDLKFHANVTGLEPGNYTLDLTLETSQKVTLSPETTVKIRIDKK